MGSEMCIRDRASQVLVPNSEIYKFCLTACTTEVQDLFVLRGDALPCPDVISQPATASCCRANSVYTVGVLAVSSYAEGFWQRSVRVYDRDEVTGIYRTGGSVLRHSAAVWSVTTDLLCFTI